MRALGLALIALAGLAVAQRPNVLVIMTDDAGYADFGFMGSKQFKTPNIDRLADEGVVYTNAYVSGPSCSPSRAGFLSGRYQQKFGHEYNLGARLNEYNPELRGIHPEEKTIGERLQKAGYRTALIGKWHQGELPAYHPNRQGFDDFYGHLGGSHDFFKKTSIESNYREVLQDGYLTDELGTVAAEWIADNQSKPWFCFLSFNAPHTPLQATEEDLARFADIPQKNRRTMAAMTWAVDRQVGVVEGMLERTGQKERTMVIFLNDNGGRCDTGAVNAPVRGMKGTFLEGGTRVPFVVRWPGKLERKREDAPVIALDIMPTALNAAGVEVDISEMDGIDLAADLPADRPLYWALAKNAAIRVGKWKLVRLIDRLPMLYDLENDIAEQENLLLRYPDKAQELLQMLGEWELGHATPRFASAMVWRRRNLRLYDRDYVLSQPGE